MSLFQKYGYILLIVFLCTAFTIAGVIKESKRNTFIEITVNDGDTLWGLAQDFSENKRTHRWIDEVMVLNNLETSMIKTGEKLKLPVPAPISIDDKLVEMAGGK
ncbi:LysM peptidoglycan-binding domain-containing protein [Sporosarcina thermotolerans]|uniref:LysM peptidoglycan-binding domain-containing protein n=1 Tax=Sporosarcina thermotolerans TaxID=633404 RepID=A0AAW9A606_9BACL|nr:LysM peptidoglycan-binding domain-containing protein [Sporosarcina thermotolerans]MDW0115650.1 LysM peptidoglycan-binding domain-containing protein [Sporosarcina thermotolerans]WHT47062.1 LysM peptidoglycan-binding domain-containing protein [Sporosarcina thermotolerans]